MFADLSRRFRAPRLGAVVDDFLFAKEAEGRAERTIEWYRSRLRTLVARAGGVPARKVDADELRRWLIAVRAGRKGRRTRDTYVASHRAAAAAFFTWAIAEGKIARSPVASVGRMRARRREIVILTRDEVERMIEARSERTELGIRDRAMIAFLYDTGARAGELAHLRLTDVHLAEGIALVNGKTGERCVPLGMKLRGHLLAYMSARPRMLAFAESGILFLGRRGSPLQENGVDQMIRRAARAAGISKRVYPHLLRHSFATQYIRNGGDPYTLQIILGHSTPAMVTRYMHMAATDAEARHAIASPLDHLPLAVAQ